VDAHAAKRLKPDPELGMLALPPGPKMVNFRESPIPVSAEPGCTEHVQKALDCQKFKMWLQRVENDKNFEVEKIHFQSIDMFGPKNVGFLKFKLTSKAGGKDCPGIIFMRGGAPAILVVLKRQYDGELFTITVNQPRIAAGSSSFCEIPAGMLDNDGNLAGVAAKEMKEETGLVINAKELINLTELAHGPESNYQGIYSTCGGSDEYNPIFLHRKVVEAEFIDKLQGKKTGVETEFEDITLKVIPLKKLWQESADSKALSALCLHDKLLESGRLEAF
jgi:ADP-sugar diphosphatase